MKEEKNLDQVVALLALAANASNSANTETSVQANACLDPEEIAAMAEGRLSWERRHRLMRHLTACPACYRVWLEVAERSGGLPRADARPAGHSPRLSWKTLGYAGGALAAVAACLAVFLHRPTGMMDHKWTAPVPASVSQPMPPAPVDDRPKPVAEQMDAPAQAEKGVTPGTVGGLAKGGEATAERVKEKKLAAKNKEEALPKTAAITKKQAKTEQLVKEAAAPPPPASKPAGKKNGGNIEVNAVELRRSADQLTAWYTDLRQLCRQPRFQPNRWTSLYSKGADILESLPEDSQDEKTDRLWLILGQMEGLTAERRQNFCAWSEKELTHNKSKKKKGR